MTQGPVINHEFKDDEGHIIANVRHDMHGQYFHNICIFIAEMLAVEGKCKILDGDAWRKKTISPGVPDLVYERYFKVKENGKWSSAKELSVVEIDTNGGKAEKQKKWVQFVRDNPGYELYYIDMSKFEEVSDEDYIGELIAYINARMST